MFPPECIWCILLAVHGSAWALQKSKYGGDAVVCSQGLSDCHMENVLFNANTVAVRKLKPEFKLCCEDRAACTLCLEIELELDIALVKDMEVEDQSGNDDDEEADKEKTANEGAASVILCYHIHRSFPTCKKVEFTVNHTAIAQQNQTKVSIIITLSKGFSYGNQINFSTSPAQVLVAPSLNEVCSQKRQKRIPECRVPKFNISLNLTTNQVELQFKCRNKTKPTLCVQYEEKGTCRKLSQKTIPLYSVAPCMCIQAWYETDQESRHTQMCPFRDLSHYLQQNTLNNVSVNVRLSKMSHGDIMLLWNLSAPCRLDGEVQLCYKSDCRQKNDQSQQLSNGTWRQNSKGLWEREGAFECIDKWISQCVTVKVNGLEHQLGPICTHDAGRWRWSLLVVGVLLLVCLTALMIYCLHDYVKKWAWSWRHGGFVKIGKKGHVLLLSPPDVDDSVSESVCQLGSLLYSHSFSLSVDQFSRKEQCAQGPLLWLHSQMLKLDSMGGRVLLVLTSKASERIEEWSRSNRDEETETRQWLQSPYSDLFAASLFLIHAYKKLGKASERFVLVKFDSNQRHVPELLQGLPLFQLPSQTQALLTELTVAETKTGPGGRMWMGWR